MSDKKLVWLGLLVGSTAGSLVPELWHAGFLSGWSIILSGVGGLLGIWAAYRLING